MKTEISLSAIRDNLDAIERATGKPVILMVKADAYGHGLIRVARSVPAVMYGVATAEEGILLREMGKEVLVTAPSAEDIDLCRRYDMVPMIGNETLAFRAILCGLRRCHIKVNSGMNRFGFSGEKLCYRVARDLLRGGVRIQGIATHYLSEKDENLLSQNARFDQAVLAIEKALTESAQPMPYTHVTGSGALYAEKYDALRVGLAAYGYHAAYTAGIPLRKAMIVTSEILTVKTLRRGDTLGYGGSYRANRRMTVCTVRGGYGDGVSREEVGRSVLLRGRKQKIAAVCMDSFEMISEGVLPRIGEKVILLSEKVDADYIARYRRSIPYAVLLGYDVPRAKRIYDE